jgi:predicted transcriptional regulator
MAFDKELTIEELCRKLRPFFGKKIDSLYLRYRLAERGDEKFEIEQAISALYHKHLNQSMLSQKILLEPPKKEIIGGDYPLGVITYAEKEYYPFGLRDRDWPRHVCINGMSGSGKTNFAFIIIGNLIKNNKPFWIFDWKKSFRSLVLVDDKIKIYTIGNSKINNNFRININRPPKGVPPKEWISLLSDMITESFFASYGVHKILVETLDEAFGAFGVYEGSENYPTWHQLKDRLETKEEEMKIRNRESEWLISALRIAHALTFGDFGEVIGYKGKDSVRVEDYFGDRLLFELHSLNSSQKKFFCEFILSYLYKYKKTNENATRGEFTQAIIIDEAHNIFLKEKPNFIKEGVTEVVYREIREYGVGLICLDQHISKLSDVVAGNSACNVAFQQVLPDDLEQVSGIMQLREHKDYFSMLQVGEALVKLSERHTTPFMIKTPLVHLKDEVVTDEDLRVKMGQRVIQDEVEKGYVEERVKKEISEEKEKMDEVFKASGVAAPEEFLEEQIKIKKPEFKLDNEEKKFLDFIAKNEGFNISKIYELFNISVRRGNAVKKKLEDLGLIATEVIKHDKGWKKELRITKRGAEILKAKI